MTIQCNVRATSDASNAPANSVVSEEAVVGKVVLLVLLGLVNRRAATQEMVSMAGTVQSTCPVKYTSVVELAAVLQEEMGVLAIALIMVILLEVLQVQA